MSTPGLPPAFQFMMYFTQLNVALSRLLGVRFIAAGGQSEGGPVGVMLGSVIAHNNGGQHEFRDRELTKLTMLAEDLQQIETYSPELLRHFQRAYQDDTRSQYFGTRMEIATAAILIRQQVAFDKGESPDFHVPLEGGRISIECGSTHLAGGKTSGGEKIASAVREKAVLHYFNTSTALFLDVTNILHNSLRSRNYLEQKRIEQIVGDEMRGRHIGAAVLFFYVLDKTADRFELATFRIDNPTVDPVLLGFLERYFPTDGGRTMADYDIPSEG